MELFRLSGVIDIDNKNANRALEETSQTGQKAESKLGKFFSGVGKGAAVVGKAVGTGMMVAGTAMGGLTVKAMNLGGELEQNMGGSEAVFGKHAGKMQETAKSAFSNMGLSTSDYLATANKMGALFQGAGFDIEESMGLSSDAMQRAADVASIMGIDTSAAMEAIAGAAKGNFTMMDNLGVAMNDTTLNAYALEKGIGKTTREMTNQEKIGLAMEMFMEKTAYAAGNYAKENETLAGSLGTAKSALTNFLDGSGDVNQLVDAFSNAAKVIVKNISELAPRLISGITDIINQIMPMLPPLLNQLLPVIIEGAVSLINGLVAAMPSIISAIMAALPALIDGVVQIVNALIEALPQMMQLIINALPTLIPALIDGLVSMVVILAQNINQIIMPLVEAMPLVITSIIEALMANLPELLKAGGYLLQGLLEGMIAFIVNIPSFIAQIFAAIWNGICSIFGIHSPSTVMMEIGKNIILGIFEGIKSLLNSILEIWNTLKDFTVNAFNSIKDFAVKIWNNLKESVSNIVKTAKDAVVNTWNNLKNSISNIFNATKDIIVNIWNNIKNAFSNALGNIKNSVSNGFNSVKTTVSNAISNVKEKISSGLNAARDTVSNILGGIKDKFTSVFDKATDIVKNSIDKIKGFFSGLKLELPKIKLPHFKLDGKFSLNPPSTPKIGVDWYAKAMNNPMIMDSPTIFGYNAETGKYLGGGEAGSEVISGTNTLMGMIQNAVSIQNGELIAVLLKILNAIISMDESMGENLREALAGTAFEINRREFGRLVKAVT